MTTALIIVFALIMLAIIWASYIQNRTRWSLCPRCFHWHNEIGERTEHAPEVGRLHKTELCKHCSHD